MYEFFILLLWGNLLEDLQSPDYQTREITRARLLELGCLAFPILEKGDKHYDAEVRHSCRSISLAYYEFDDYQFPPINKLFYKNKGTMDFWGWNDCKWNRYLLENYCISDFENEEDYYDMSSERATRRFTIDLMRKGVPKSCIMWFLSQLR